MGFIAKAATKKRVQPVEGALNEALRGTPWLTTGGIPTGAIVRSVVLSLDLTGARSSSFRGRRPALAGLVAPTSASHLWVETNDFKGWDFILGGNDGRDGIAADWAVHLKIADATATVGTSRYHTSDDVLVHGEHHDALRDQLLLAVAQGKLNDANAEDDISTTSLRTPQSFSAPAPEPFDVSFTIATSLDTSSIQKQCRLTGYRVLSAAPDSVSWGLGLPKNQAADFVVLGLASGGLRGIAQVRSDGAAGRRIAAWSLRKFIKRTHFLIRKLDENASYDGPEEFKP
jgi:hypothetical protein